MADETPKGDTSLGGKGKGKAYDDGMTDATATPAEPSLAARVAFSASGLIRDAVGSSNGHVPDLITTSTALGSKVQSSGSSSGHTEWAKSGAIRPGGPLNGSTAGHQDLGRNDTFRTPQAQSSAAELEFANFVSTPSVTFGSNAQLEHSLFDPLKPEEQHFGQDHIQRSARVGDISRSYFAKPIQLDDGAEVRNLLSDPAFDSAFGDDTHDSKDAEPSDAYQVHYAANQSGDGAEVRNLLSAPVDDSILEDGLAELTLNELPTLTANVQIPPTYSDLEQEIITAMKADLPAPPIHKDLPTDHPLNLRPLSDAEKASLPQQISEYEEALASRGQSLATLPSEEERELWLSDWEDVLSGYTDQVWGDILPAVRAAKSELEDVRTGSAALDSKTIARLKMILGHVHKHAGPPAPDLTLASQQMSKKEGS